ncbi:MAG: exosortase/archaeosortase family protein [Candidatus Eisenbacteria bacterium]|nr:exosortase/archaeosortase family protein [Candidatus Eisenbacteria bacterium]
MESDAHHEWTAGERPVSVESKNGGAILAVANLRRPGIWLIGAWALAAGAIVFAYQSTMVDLWNLWMRNPNYSHGFLIPPVAAWLVWRQRSWLTAEKSRAGWRGIALLLPAAVLQIVGLRGDVVALQGLSLVLALAGAALQIHGVSSFRRLLFPLAFLLFMLPLMPWFVHGLSYQLKVVAARGAVAIAKLMGVIVHRDGVNLLFPGGTLEVENACSGLRSLVALLALGALFAYLAHRGVVRRVVLFALALPIAVAANVVRIAALCVYAGIAGPQEAAGAFHTAGGYALFLIAFAMLVVSKGLLRC